MRRSGQAMIVGLLLAGAAAQAQTSAPLQYAPPGTRFTWEGTVSGGTRTNTFTVMPQRGNYAAQVFGNETNIRTFTPGCRGCAGNIDDAEWLRLWPLRVGNATTLTRTDRQRNRSWIHTIRVLRTETIQLRVGPVQTFVIEDTSVENNGPWRGTRLTWWAPSLGWPVREVTTDNQGVNERFEVIAHQRP
jgi:hypothetical protein